MNILADFKWKIYKVAQMYKLVEGDHIYKVQTTVEIIIYFEYLPYVNDFEILYFSWCK